MFYVSKNKNNGLRSFRDSFFDDFFSFPVFAERKNLMKTDIKEENGNYVLDIDLPGYEKEDIKLSVEDNYLIVEAKKETSESEERENYVRRERYVGSATRSFYLENVDFDKIKATYKNGILSLNVPKMEEKEEVKKYITIE